MLLQGGHGVVGAGQFFFTNAAMYVLVASGTEQHRLIELFAAVSLFESVVLVLGAGDEVMFGELGDVAIAEGAGGCRRHCENLQCKG